MATPGTHRVQDPFFTYRLHSRSKEFETPRISGALGKRSGEARAFQAPEKILDPENAARFHLQQLFEQETEAPLRTLLAEDRPQVLPDLNLRDVLELPKTQTLLVRFRQAHRSVPIFGSNAAVQQAPGYADAWAMLSMLYREEYTHRFNLRPDPIERAFAAARRAVEAAPSNHLAHHALASAQFFRRELRAFVERHILPCQT